MKIPHIKGAFKNIQKACDKKLSELYPSKVPEDILARYNQELNFLKDSEYVDDFEIFRLMSKEATKASSVIKLRGTVLSSYIIYLLGNGCFNPLPTHYYCSKCGHYETISTHLFGIDLPEKTCPECGCSILADGYNLQPENVWGNDGKKILSIDYSVSSEFMPFANRMLSSIYSDNIVVPWGMFQFDSITKLPNPDNRVVGVELTGYAILPEGNTIDDYPDLISYLEDGTPCITGGGWELEDNFIKPIRLFNTECIDTLLKLQRATGIYANEISTKELRNITWSNIANTAILNTTTSGFFHELKPKTYRDMVYIDSLVHDSYPDTAGESLDMYRYKQITSTDAFKKYPCTTREDFFDYLLEAGIERSFAFEISEKIRKGNACSMYHKEEFDALPIPEEIKEVAKNYTYLFPRCHCIEYMLTYARIAYYAKVDSRTFSKIRYKNK